MFALDQAARDVIGHGINHHRHIVRLGDHDAAEARVLREAIDALVAAHRNMRHRVDPQPRRLAPADAAIEQVDLARDLVEYGIERLVQQLEAGDLGIVQVDDDGGALGVIDARLAQRIAQALRGLVRRGRFDIPTFGEAKARGAGLPIVIDDTRRHSHANAWLQAGIGAIVTAPLVTGGRSPAMMWVSTPGPRAWHAEEIALLRDSAARAWTEMSRARAEAALRPAIEIFLAAVAKALSCEAGETLGFEIGGSVPLPQSAWHLRAAGISPAGPFALIFPAELVERLAPLLAGRSAGFCGPAATAAAFLCSVFDVLSQAPLVSLAPGGIGSVKPHRLRCP